MGKLKEVDTALDDICAQLQGSTENLTRGQKIAVYESLKSKLDDRLANEEGEDADPEAAAACVCHDRNPLDCPVPGHAAARSGEAPPMWTDAEYKAVQKSRDDALAEVLRLKGVLP